MTYQPGQLPITNNQLLLFGGRSLTGTILADLWAFDLTTSTWSVLDPGGGGSDPPARMAHTLTYDPLAGNAVLVGGTSDGGDTLLGDTWHYAGSWSEGNPDTPLPARAYQQAIYGDEAIILFSNGEVWSYE